MINIFNKTQLIMTNSNSRFEKLCEALKAAGVEYKTKSVDRHRPGSLESATERVGQISEVVNAMYNHYIYVKKSDLETAKNIVKKL